MTVAKSIATVPHGAGGVLLCQRIFKKIDFIEIRID